MGAQKVVGVIIINTSFENAVLQCLGIFCLNVQPQWHVLQKEDEDEDNTDDLFPKKYAMSLSDDSDENDDDENDDGENDDDENEETDDDQW